MIGTIHNNKNSLFLRFEVGSCCIRENMYEMFNNASFGTPIIRSKQTGKWWTVSWKELLELAVKAGIDK